MKKIFLFGFLTIMLISSVYSATFFDDFNDMDCSAWSSDLCSQGYLNTSENSISAPTDTIPSFDTQNTYVQFFTSFDDVAQGVYVDITDGSNIILSSIDFDSDSISIENGVDSVLCTSIGLPSGLIKVNILFSLDNDSVYLYVNDILKCNQTNSGIATYNYDQIRFSNFFSSYIDDVFVGTISFQEYNTSCVENWTASYTPCSIGDNQTLIYTDDNNCGTFGDLPIDNGTISACNYCTLQYHVENSYNSTCIGQGDSYDVLYFLDNYGTCCNLTGKFEDCEDFPTSLFGVDCGLGYQVGQYEADDIPAVTIDFATGLGIFLISMISIIGIVLILKFGKELLRR